MRLVSLTWLVSVFAAAACGGSTTRTEATGGTSGSGATAGTAAGGTSAGGTAAGGTSAGGMGGSSATGGSGNAAGWSACSAPGTCMLFATNCCGGYCDVNAPLSGYLAVNQAKVNDVEAQLCAGDIACPGCLSMDNPNHLALCRSGECNAVDLRTDALSACAADSDCRVRWGSNCCEDCGGGNTEQLVVYNKNANLEAEVCAPNGGACPPCAPPAYPPYILPYCGPDKHCTWTLVGP